MLHDSEYREHHEIDLRRDFPRAYFEEDFAWWVEQGRELLDLHLNFETAEPWPLDRQDKAGVAPRRAILRANRQDNTITIDEQTTLAGSPPKAWEYRLGARSAPEWVLNQYKERRTKTHHQREVQHLPVRGLQGARHRPAQPGVRCQRVHNQQRERTEPQIHNRAGVAEPGERQAFPPAPNPE